MVPLLLVSAVVFAATSPDSFSGVIEVKLTRDTEFSITGSQLRTPSNRALLDIDTSARGFTGGSTFDIGRMRMRHLFASPVAQLRQKRALLEARTGKELPDLAGYVRISVPTTSLRDVELMLARLKNNPAVEDAYAVPVLHRPSVNLVPDQDYLRAAPGGINADSTELAPNTRGAGIRIGDVEHGWDLMHEDLPFCENVNFQSEADESDHGTAVLGELFGLRNGSGVNGIAPDATCAVADWLNDSQQFDASFAMQAHAEQMGAGDVVILEVQVYGPRTPAGDTSCFGCLPAEYVKSTYDTTKLLTAQGIIVVAAAGNGSQDLDDPFYKGYFARSRSSGAILVGAGASSESNFPRSRMSFSNYGERVDVQGFGEKVTTTGYGTIGAGHASYTHSFNGTSSATPIVTGSVAVINGYLIANHKPPLNAAQMSDLLKATGTAQYGTQHIGPLPNLTAALASFGSCGDGIKIAPEVCDDGNTKSGDGCSLDCSSNETCGNGVLDTSKGEKCDDGNHVNGDGCRSDCSGEESCGDGRVDAREVCDDGNEVSGDGCSSDCKRREVCGDKVIDTGEMCDDGNTQSSDGCSYDCKSTEHCGNGYVDASEICDDGNYDETDACTSVCTYPIALEPQDTSVARTTAATPTTKAPTAVTQTLDKKAAGCSGSAAPSLVLLSVFFALRAARLRKQASPRRS